MVDGLKYNDHLVISPHLTELDEAGSEPGEHLPQLHRVPPLQPLVLSDLPPGVVRCNIIISAVKRSIGSTTGCTITEKAPTRAFSWLNTPASAFTSKTLC